MPDGRYKIEWDKNDPRYLFLNSNYCFTEIPGENRNGYINKLFSKIKNGFIIWQTIFGLDISKVNTINKSIKNIIEEKPQTANAQYPNFFVYF